MLTKVFFSIPRFLNSSFTAGNSQSNTLNTPRTSALFPFLPFLKASTTLIADLPVVITSSITTAFYASENKHLAEACKQLQEYFAKERTSFDLPLDVEGTDYQVSVWNELQKIPYGEVRTYQDIATALGNPKAVRAVGMANNRNPICIVVPCHRVVGKNNKLTGYAAGIDKKEYLLNLESGK